MREEIEKRMAELRKEYESGQKVLGELEAKQAQVKETLLRISGAIQVLEEMLQDTARVSDDTVTAELSEAATD